MALYEAGTSRCEALAHGRRAAEQTKLSHWILARLSESRSDGSRVAKQGPRGGQVLVSDLQNTSQNLVVQLACSSLGVACLSQRPSLGRAYAIDANTLPTPNRTQMARPRTTRRS